MGDSALCSNEVLIRDLRTWQQHAIWFVNFTKKAIDKSADREDVLTLRSEAALSTMAIFVKELHLQLLECAEKFEADIKSFLDEQVSEIAKRNDLLRQQIEEAESSIKKIDVILKSSRQLTTEGRVVVQQCEQFFSTCYDGSSFDDKFEYLEFIRAGNLIVLSEHIGYIRRCDAWPSNVDLVKPTAEQALIGRVYKVLIRTNHSNCVNAASSLTFKLKDPENNELPVELKNNNDGTYYVIFIPQQAVRYDLHVQLFRIEVKGSPMQIDVIEDPDKRSRARAVSQFPVDINLGKHSVEKVDHSNKVQGCGRGSGALGVIYESHPGTKYQNTVAAAVNKTESKRVGVSPSELLTELSIKEEVYIAELTDEPVKSGNLTSSSRSDRKWTASGKNEEYVPGMLSNSLNSNLTQAESPSSSFGHPTRNRTSVRKRAENSEPAIKSKLTYSFSESVDETTTVESMDIKSEIIEHSNVSVEYPKPPDPYVDLAKSVDKYTTGTVMSELSTSHKSERESRGAAKPTLSSVTKIDVSRVFAEYVEKGVQKVKTQYVKQIGQPGDADDSLFMPVGVTVNRGGDVIVCDMRHNAVKVFSSDGHLLFLIKDSANARLLRPSAAVVNDRNQIFIKDDKCLHLYNSDGSFVKSIGAGELTRPYGLAINKYDQLVTVDVTRSGPPSICTYTQKGSLVKRCLFAAMGYPMLYTGSKLRFIECVDDALFIVDLGNSVVFKTDFDGNLITSFGHMGRALGEFNEPSGITKSDDVVLVADSRNNRIQVFTADGVVRGYVELTESIVRPSDIHLSNDGLLYVSNYLKHCIKVYRIIPL